MKPLQAQFGGCGYIEGIVTLSLFLVGSRLAKITSAPLCKVIQQCADGISYSVLQTVFDMKHNFTQVLAEDDPVNLQFPRACFINRSGLKLETFGRGGLVDSLLA